MRSIWKGSIAFGLVNVPVKVYSATEDHDIKFHQVHAKDNGRIRYKRVCEVCGEVVEYRDIAKAFESDDGQMVVITDEDIATLPEERSREIEVLEFVPASDIDPMMYDKSYFLEPDGKSSKSYVLLTKTLKETDRVAIVHFALRNKTRLAALRVQDFSKRDVMIVQTLLWPDEIRDPDFPVLDKEVEIKPAELKMASQVVESMTDDFNRTAITTTIKSSCMSSCRRNSKVEKRLPPKSRSQRSSTRPRMSQIYWPSWRRASRRDARVAVLTARSRPRKRPPRRPPPRKHPRKRRRRRHPPRRQRRRQPLRSRRQKFRAQQKMGYRVREPFFVAVC
jgi:DNA end-binding protein Ku